ncbi:uncharacterized protein LOC124898890 isoform X1 [Capsicum annuum]|uniref:uncharacterized protein LOC124898890 isoform X1 n=1 Tax=Capsicum annuum TaxID=4072 RepID=UPI001FB198D1|nr:uncharacterized protein LOC124898890 isoform X1 [Capsicum annuum]
MENCNSLDQTAPATPPSKGWRRLRLLIQATAILRAANRTPSEVDLMLANSADEIRPFLNHSEEQVGDDKVRNQRGKYWMRVVALVRFIVVAKIAAARRHSMSNYVQASNYFLTPTVYIYIKRTKIFTTIISANAF